jgi:hypothetical protein
MRSVDTVRKLRPLSCFIFSAPTHTTRSKFKRACAYFEWRIILPHILESRSPKILLAGLAGVLRFKIEAKALNAWIN